MTFPVLTLSDHPEAALLRAIVRATAIYDQGSNARLRGEQAALRWLRKYASEAVALDDEITATRARTPEGIRAKVEYALRDVDPGKQHFGKGGCFAVAYSALWDVMAADSD